MVSLSVPRDVVQSKRIGEQGRAHRQRSTRDTGETPDSSQFLPVDKGAEIALIGALMMGGSEVIAQCPHIEPGDFHTPLLGAMWDAAQRIAARGEHADLITVQSELALMGESGARREWVLNSVRYANQCPNSFNAPQYAKTVREYAIRRRGIQYAADFAAAFYERGGDGLLEALDLMRQSIAEDLAALATETTESPFLTADEAMMLEPARGILGEVLYEDSQVLLYGPSGSWKSFVALDMALCLATGREWLGRPVTGGGHVIYIAAEGLRGYRKRIRAWTQRHGVTTIPPRFHLARAPLNLMSSQDVARLIARTRQHILKGDPEARIAAIFIDTIARSMPGGDENSTEDTGVVVESMNELRRAFGCCVVGVHHTGKDVGRGPRGNSRFYNDADTVIRVNGPRDDAERLEPGEPVRLVSDKAKDNEPFKAIALTTVEERWTTDDGEVETSLVIVPHEDTAPTRERGPSLTPNHRKVLAALVEIGAVGAGASKWQRASGLPGSSFYHSQGTLVKLGLVAKHEDGSGSAVYRPTQEGYKAAGPVTPLHSKVTPIGAAGGLHSTPPPPNITVALTCR